MRADTPPNLFPLATKDNIVYITHVFKASGVECTVTQNYDKSKHEGYINIIVISNFGDILFAASSNEAHPGMVESKYAAQIIKNYYNYNEIPWEIPK